MAVSFDNGWTFYYTDVTDYTVNITFDGATGPTYFGIGVYPMTLWVKNIWNGYTLSGKTVATVSVRLFMG